MAVDYEAIAGFTVKIPEKNLDLLLDEHDDLEEVFDHLDIEHETIGCSMTGSTEVIPLMIPNSAVNVDGQIKDWLDNINTKLSTQLTVNDVKFIKDLYIS